MTHSNQLSRREKEVAGFLLQGKSNKQIALTLNITEHTVEFHLKNVYAKLNVGSRVEAILKLQETTGILGDSAVDEVAKTDNTVIDHGKPDRKNKDGSGIARKISLEDIIRFFTTYKAPVFIWILLSLILILILRNRIPWTYTRQGEYPDEFTVGQVLQRSNASEGMVHGQFGTVPAWPVQAGYVKYDNIKTPQVEHMFFKLRYSKYSSSSVPILIYLDNESSPRGILLPVNQGAWEKFIWSDFIDLGKVERGTHSIKFYTDGQIYGVADLDEFFLSESRDSLPPP